jgi:hypothetical protein
MTGSGKRRRDMRSDKGAVSLGFLIFLFLVALGIYLGFKLIPPHWEYYSLKEATRQGLVSSSAPPYRDADVKEAVLQKARNLGVPLSEADLVLFRDRQAVSIEFSWEREVVLPGRVKRYSFTIKDSEPIH